MLYPACNRLITPYQRRQCHLAGVQRLLFNYVKKKRKYFLEAYIAAVQYDVRNLFLQTYKVTERSTLNVELFK